MLLVIEFIILLTIASIIDIFLHFSQDSAPIMFTITTNHIYLRVDDVIIVVVSCLTNFCLPLVIKYVRVLVMIRLLFKISLRISMLY
jgi:dihydroorotase